MTTRPGKRITTESSEAPENLVGRMLDGRYRLDSLLSVGGMGIIFEGYQLAMDRKVAVKVLRPSMARDLDFNTRFRHEVDTLSRLDHPNIIATIDSGLDASGLHYLVMRYVEGRTFRESLRDVELTLPEILDVFAQTCDALTAAHAAGIIHRDLKFENIMVGRLPDDRIHATVLDFGVAKVLSRNEAITRAGEVPGTPSIIAPELADAIAPSPQSDLYSIGILLFTAITGDHPFQGDNDFELMRAHKFEDLPRLEPLVGKRVPEQLIELVYELAQKEPALRPASAAAVRESLQRIAADIRREHQVLPGYHPPSGDALGIEEDVDRSAVRRSTEFLADVSFERDEGAEEQAPMLVPTSLVSLLIVLVLVLVLVLLYLIFQMYVVSPR